jgi:PhnB protein
VNVTPHISFNGDCETAFKFYEKCLGGKITFMMTYVESPMAGDFPAEMGKKILHASFALDGTGVFSGDDSPQYTKPQGITIALSMKDPAEAERVFAGLAENGVVGMALQETFWAVRFGLVTDRFGVPWMINCEKSQ